MSSPQFYIAIHDFSGSPKSPEDVYERVEKGSLLTRADTPPSAHIRADPLLPPPPLWLRVQETQRVVGVDKQSVVELGSTLGRMLMEVTDAEERLAFFKDSRRLKEVLELKTGDPVRVQVTSSSGHKERGVLRYRGPVCHKQGLLFGVQLVGSGVGKGFTDGSFRGQKFFECEENCGVFVPGSRLDRDYNEHLVRRSGRTDDTSSWRQEEYLLGSRNPPEQCPRAVNFLARGVRQHSPQRAGEKNRDSDLPPSAEDRSVKRLVPEEHILHDEEEPKPLTTNPEGEESSFYPSFEDHYPPSSLYCPPRHGSPSSLQSEAEPLRWGLEVNSMVEVHEPPIFGVIRWIGHIPEIPDLIAGLEMEQEMPSACTDGIYRGSRYFHCGPNKALFVKLRNCRPDSRFFSVNGPKNQVLRCNSVAFSEYASKCVEENTPPVTGSEAESRLIGWKKGIQGHCNSCYLDATLFCMFACSSVLDTMLLRPPDKNDSDSYTDTRDLLRTEIVNPLRKDGYVCATKVMALRKILEAAGKSTGFTSEEKDPEEFLNQLFQVLRVEPLFYIRQRKGVGHQCHKSYYPLREFSQIQERAILHFPAVVGLQHPPSSARTSKKKPQGCIFYQIFMEKRQSVNVPSVQQLLEWSMVTGDLKFTEAPSCLIIQMPRNGKNFKMFPTILPTLELDITDLLEDAPRQCCICQSLAVVECPDCYEDTDITPGHIKQYCAMCSKQVHLHKQRCAHHPRELNFPKNVNEQAAFQRQRMQLYAVLCIETSHYVAFIRLSSQNPPLWAFFDSMADREGGENGFNIPRVTPCQEVTEYLKMTSEELQQEDPRSMPTYARRLLCDAYMCLYYSPDLSLYK